LGPVAREEGLDTSESSYSGSALLAVMSITHWRSRIAKPVLAAGDVERRLYGGIEWPKSIGENLVRTP
jgi:hypothetical protein